MIRAAFRGALERQGFSRHVASLPNESWVLNPSAMEIYP
jgi:hypothetical protein